MPILLLEDKLGITDGYRGHWQNMCLAAGLNPNAILHRSIYRHRITKDKTLMLKKGNRKTPGFEPEAMPYVAAVVKEWIRELQPELILCQDLVSLGLVERSWDIATIDNCRGGVYEYEGIKFVITVPISAINTKKSPKDIRAINDGYDDKDEWEEDEDRDPEELFLEPYTIPFGRWVLGADLRKVNRLLSQ